MKLRITVDAYNSPHWEGGAWIEVPDALVECFEPLKTCDDRVLAKVTGEVLLSSCAARRVLKLRKEAAKEIAEELSRALLFEMGKLDTSNGYSK